VQRGDLYVYVPVIPRPGISIMRLIVSSDAIKDANTSANVIMAKTGHKSLRSVQRYVKPGLAAVHQATETLSSPQRHV
jgi:hypothetical protein